MLAIVPHQLIGRTGLIKPEGKRSNGFRLKHANKEGIEREIRNKEGMEREIRNARHWLIDDRRPAEHKQCEIKYAA